ncbi:MAG: molecular chaperone [Burkholderiaceae bacterium]|nr:molecular chaperone [Burkholderiaceae bacterium]
MDKATNHLTLPTFAGALRHLLFAGLAALATSAQALSFTPIEVDFSPSGRGATQVFRLENTTAEPAAVEIGMKTRKMESNGDDILGDADDQFSIFPAQVVLQPGQVQTIRVQYTGPAQITAERAFRLIAEQLPVDVGQVAQTGGRMRLLVKYVASAYVVPANVKAILSVPQARLVRDAQGAWLEVSVRNEGTTRKILTGARLGLGDRVIDTAALKGMAGENILAGTTRTFRIPAPANLAEPLPPVRLLVD